MKILDKKIALITGASRGIGKSIALRFAEEGANIVFTDLKYDENAANLEKELREYGVEAKFYASDASSFTGSEELVKKVLNDFGTIDILVNNAGITRDNLLMRMTEKDWDMVITVNLKSVFNLTKAVQRTMLKARKGAIIKIGRASCRERV